MLNSIQILLFSTICTFLALVFHPILLWQSWWREPPKWTPEPEVHNWWKAGRLPWIKHLGCGYQLSKGLCICQTCSNTARVTFHLKQGNKPSHPSPFSPALYLWPQAVAKGSGSDPADSTWLLTPPSYKSNCSVTVKAVVFPPLQRTVTSSSAKEQHKEFYVKTLLSMKRKNTMELSIFD